MRALSAACLVLVLSISVAHAYTSPGSPTGFVNDFAGILSQEEQALLENELALFAASTTNEIAVVTVTNLGGDYIENYAVKLFEEWGIGSSKNNNGVLLLLALEERELRIEVGYGLEGALPDSVADRIIRNDMVPELREGNYGQAISRGVTAIQAATRGEYVAEPGDSTLNMESLFPLLMFGFVGLQWVLAILARTKSWWLGGVIGLIAGGALSTIFGWWLLWGAIATLVLASIGFALDAAVSSAYKASIGSGRTPPWWTGGSSGGWSGGRSGGGFGGFGGGRSGGGGASGRW